MAVISPTPKLQFFDANGNPLVGGKLYSFEAGTTTPIVTYTDASGNTPNTNPVILDSRGEASVWLGSALYKLRLTTATDVDVWTVDNVGGAVTLQQLATSGGSALVGFLPAGPGADVRTVESKLRDFVSVKDFGATGLPGDDATLAINEAQAYLATVGGGTLYFPVGEYRVTAPIVMTRNVTYRGPGKAALQGANNKSKIFSTNSDIFRNSSEALTEICFRDLEIESQPGGGHVFNWSGSGIVAKIEVDGCALLQRNASKCVLYGVGPSEYIGSLWFHDFEFAYEPANTNPAINIACTTVNSVVIDKFWSTCMQQNSTGKPAIHIESTNPGGAAFNITVRDGVFEFPASGSIRLLSVTHAIIDNCMAYDVSIPTGYYQFSVDKGAGPPSTQVIIRNCRSTPGNATWPDLFLNTNVSGQGQFLIESSKFAHTNGGANMAPPTTKVVNSDLGAVVNLAYTADNTNAFEQIAFKSTDPVSAKVAFWNGFVGNQNGVFNIDIDGVTRGRMLKNGNFYWGGTSSLTDNFFILPEFGTIGSGRHIYPGVPGGGQQQVTGFLAGTGAPLNSGTGPNAGGNNGDFYFRSDGGPMTTIYQKRAGVWVGIV